MNKVILQGRLTRDPEVKYSQGAEPLAVVRFGLAVPRKFKKEGEQEADFINCVAFGKTGEFTGKYFKKGQQILIGGRLSVNPYTDKDGNKRTSTEVIVEEQHFCGSKSESQQGQPQQSNNGGNFYQVDNSIDDDNLPF